MKKLFAIGLAAILLISLVPATMVMADNGAPSGEHFTLNIIAKDAEHAKTQPKEGGHVIFVSLEGHNKIELIKGDDFAVLDGNAFDDPAQFQLPDPDLAPYVIEYPHGEDTLSAYSVYVRPLGKPGGSATITTCAELASSGWMDFLSNKMQKDVNAMAVLNDDGYFGGYASIEQVAVELPLTEHGKPKFENVTAELLTILFEITVTDEAGNEETVYVRVPIFDPLIQGEYWDFENDGLRIVQVRFYPGVQTDVSAGDPAPHS